ncbi:XkdW family protein [Deinococcus wulumuqiensis]|uniref:XkdW family protein n=1 Tax=Deinococcus wulumuqiensis TaxID=980427 RepID=UPI00242D358B|nr:XkdW family protein [Deinococcus wulumuqiensis]
MIALVLRHLYPDADPLRDYVVADDGSGPRLITWNLAAPQPTPAELDAALPAAQARVETQQEMVQVQGMLDERYRMYTRALATGNGGAASEIQAEITDILAYLKELRDASRSA